MSKLYTEEDLQELAAMWIETAILFRSSGTPTMQQESAIYLDCANELKRVLMGDKKDIEKWDNRAPRSE